MTDRISTDELRKLMAEATPGPWVFEGERVKASDRTVSDLRYKNGKNDGLLIATTHQLAAEVIELREALGEIQRLASLVSNDLMGRVEASKVSAVMTCSAIARAALNHKETE